VNTSRGLGRQAWQEPPQADPALPRLRDGLRSSLLTFVGVRIGLSVLSWVAIALIEPRQLIPTVPGWAIEPIEVGWRAIVTATERQDAAWFLRIATGGYAPDDGSAAFFPLYPLAIKVVAWLPGVGPLGAALLISNMCFLGALVMLHGLTRLEGWSDHTARTTILLIAIFPTAFFFLAPYSESPFLLLSVSAFWFARRDRWALAGLMGALAALTRSIGLLLVLGLAVEAIQRTREDDGPLLPRLAAATTVAIGPALYFLYWGAAHANLWAPSDAQRNWQRELTFPLTTIAHAVTDAWHNGTYWLIDLVLAGVVLIAVMAGIRLLRGGYLSYALASLALPLFLPLPDRPLLSMPRFVAVLFPAFWVLARSIERRRLPEPLVVATFAGGYALLTVLFINWWHVF
jgi:Gpi18-like mannosyltransferase